MLRAAQIVGGTTFFFTVYRANSDSTTLGQQRSVLEQLQRCKTDRLL